MDYKPVLRGVMLQSMFLCRSRFKWLVTIAVFKSCMTRAFAGVPFRYYLRRTTINRRTKTNVIFIIISFFTGRSASSCPSISLAVFIDHYQVYDDFSAFLSIIKVKRKYILARRKHES